MSEEKSAWMCHICDYHSTIGSGIACSECFKITCNEHITTATVMNPESGLYELKNICVECQFKKTLNH
ncbi:hypothetical protein SAMN05660420_00906 [Desulfuromusa kysingii]|uniref:Uncharacterized protein n=1 Tax=Desulfuromusa kysingii TaxID=37625 RepID=A0A1H3XBM8_9BACT|nr:hypothetical protein [Desulfuromusa kysingii]SDZ96806.1 hypothetical protein SAMN05660420_00906 [Desulfuromusa kysingii]